MNCLTTWEVMEAAHAVKTWRNEEAVREPLACGYDNLAGSIQVSPGPPSRSWANVFKKSFLMTLSSGDNGRDSLRVGAVRVSGCLRNGCYDYGLGRDVRPGRNHAILP